MSRTWFYSVNDRCIVHVYPGHVQGGGGAGSVSDANGEGVEADDGVDGCAGEGTGGGNIEPGRAGDFREGETVTVGDVEVGGGELTAIVSVFVGADVDGLARVPQLA